MYQLPEKTSTPADPFLRAGSSFTLPGASPSSTTNLSSQDTQPSNGQATASTTAETANPPATVYKLEELKPLVPTNQAANPAPATFAEPAKLDPAQQSAASSLATAAEHSTGYRWSPNRSSAANPPASSDNLTLAERPSLFAPPPPMSGLLSPAPTTNDQLPPSTPAPSLSMPSTGFAPAPLLSSAPQPQPGLPANGMRHRIVDGDTLATIARRYYGDEQRARELFEANRSVLRDPELLPIGTELVIPGATTNIMAPSTTAPMSQGLPPLLTPPALEQFGPRTLTVSTSAWRGANEPANVATVSAAPVALSPWDQQLANATPLQQPAPLESVGC